MANTATALPLAVPPSAASSPIALRFQRLELEQKGNLSPAAFACVATSRGPHELIAALLALGDARDALYALALMLPHRQVVWWSCLGVRMLPSLAAKRDDIAAVELAETWVQSASSADAERAGEAADRCDPRQAAGWTAMAAYWSGLSLAPRGQAAVAPPPYLAGIAARTALLLAVHDVTVAKRLAFSDLLDIGLALMRGDSGRQAQAALHERLRNTA